MIKSLVKTVSGSIEQRIRKLENHAGGKYPYVIFVNYEGEPELTEAQKEAALADYKTRNHDWEESRIIVLYPEDVEFRE